MGAATSARYAAVAGRLPKTSFPACIVMTPGDPFGDHNATRWS